MKMITQPLGTEQLAGMQPGAPGEVSPDSLLHPKQIAFLEQVADDPRSAGFEGTAEEASRLRVAAVYLKEEQSAEGLARLWPSPNEGPDVQAILPATAAPEAHKLVTDTRKVLLGFDAIGQALRAERGRRRAEHGPTYTPFEEAEQWIARGWTSRTALTYSFMNQLMTRYEQGLYQPVVQMLRERMEPISDEQAAREIAGGLFERHAVMENFPGDEAQQFTGTLLGAAQRAFRRTGTTEMSASELMAHMDFDGYESIALHELASLGAIRRSADGTRVQAGDMLRVEQGRLGRIAFRAGERLLHHLHLRRIPEVRAA